MEQKLKFNNMNEQVTHSLNLVDEKMTESILHLETSLLKIRAGRASTSILEGVQVDYYGTPTFINNMASLSTPDARTIVIQPWEKKLIPEIVNAVNKMKPPKRLILSLIERMRTRRVNISIKR